MLKIYIPGFKDATSTLLFSINPVSARFPVISKISYAIFLLTRLLLNFIFSSDTVGLGNRVNSATLDLLSIIDKVPETVVSNIPLPCVPIKSLLSDGLSTKHSLRQTQFHLRLQFPSHYLWGCSMRIALFLYPHNRCLHFVMLLLQLIVLNVRLKCFLLKTM